MNNNNMQLDPAMLMKNSSVEACTKCEGFFFEQVLTFRRIPGVVTGDVKDQLIPIPLFRCADCGTPIADTVPHLKGEGGDEPDNNDDSKIIKLK